MLQKPLPKRCVNRSRRRESDRARGYAGCDLYGSLWQVWGSTSWAADGERAYDERDAIHFPLYAYNLADEMVSETYLSGRTNLTGRRTA